MRIARYSLGVCLVVTAFVACAGGSGPIAEDPLNPGSTQSGQSGQGQDKAKDDKNGGSSTPPEETDPPATLPPRPDAG
jgi:hypothetical protein